MPASEVSEGGAGQATGKTVVQPSSDKDLKEHRVGYDLSRCVLLDLLTYGALVWWNGRAGSLEYYSIHTDGKKIAGKFLCNASCMSCAVAFNGSLGECLTTSDNRSLVVNDVAAVQTCGAAATSTTSSPDPGASTDHGQAWTATVIGSTLGAFAVVWLVASAVFCRGTPPEATQTLQGDPGTQSSVSYGALKNS
eukprot:m.131912 g.131912  ORF g.131912 m.131912 type:complete len:194 (-) comp17485_c0_seq3:442-1023(-)